MKTARNVFVLIGGLISFTASAFELGAWHGVWERYSAKGFVEERITATEVIEGKLLASKIEYFKEGSPVGDGATVMSDTNGSLRASMHFTNGMKIELSPIDRDKNSMLFQLSRFNLASGEKNGDMFTRFTLMKIDDKEVIRQDLYRDKELKNKILSVDFYKTAANLTS